MIKKHWKILLITSAVILLPILAGMLLWNQLPADIPTHWNAAGEIDGWSSKGFAVFGLPLFLLALQWVAVFATSADPKKQNHSGKILHFVFWIVPLMSILLSAVMFCTALGTEVRIVEVLMIFTGFLFVVIGNYLPKCQQNYTIGIKIPWTLNSEENWNRTHRLAGFVWVAGGLAIVLAGFFGFFVLLVPVTLAMVLVPLIHSYVLHRRGI